MVVLVAFVAFWNIEGIQSKESSTSRAALVDAILSGEADTIPLNPEQTIEACRQGLDTRKNLSKTDRGLLWLKCAEAHIDLKHYRESLFAVNKALEFNSDDPYNLYLRATLQTLQMNTLKPLLDHLRAFPDDSRGLGMVAQILASNGKYAQALEFADKAIVESKGDPRQIMGAERARLIIFQRLGEHHKALESINKIIKLWHEAPPRHELADLYLLRAGVYRYLDDKAATETDLARVLRLNPNHIDALNAMVFVQSQQSHHHAAIYFAHQHTRFDNSSERSLWLLGVAYFAAGRDKEAKQMLPDDFPTDSRYEGWTWTLRGSIAMSEGNIDAAVKWYRRALACDNIDPRAYFGLAFVLSELDSSDPEIKQLLANGEEKSSDKFNCDTGAKIVQSLILGNIGNFEKAAKVLKELKINNLNPEYKGDVINAINRYNQGKLHKPKVNYLRLLHTDV